MLAFTGIRRREIFRATWSWVDLDGKTLTIRKAKRGRPSQNVVPLGPRTRATLSAYGVGDPEALIFPGFARKGGSRWASARASDRELTSMRAPLAFAIKAASVEPTGIGLHTFRHTFVTIIEQLERYSVVRALARHSRKSRGPEGEVTPRYIHNELSELYQAVVRFEQRIMEPLANVIQMAKA
jgi:integrase